MIVGMLFVTFFVVDPAVAVSTSILITHVTVIDTEQSTALANRHVLIVDEKIVEVSTTVPPVDADVEIIDGTGQYLIPGLIDSHVHLA